MSTIKNGDIDPMRGKYFESVSYFEFNLYVSLMYRLGCVLSFDLEPDGNIWVKNLGINPSDPELDTIYAPEM